MEKSSYSPPRLPHSESPELLEQAAHDRYARLMIEQGEAKKSILDLAAMKRPNKRGGSLVYDRETRGVLSAYEVWQMIEERGIQVGSKVRLAGPLAELRHKDDPNWVAPEYVVTKITPRRCLLQFHGSQQKSPADPSDYEVVEPFAVEHKQIYDWYVDMMTLQRRPGNEILSYVQLQRRGPIDLKTCWERLEIIMRTGMRLGSRIGLQSEHAAGYGTIFTITAITPTGKLRIIPKRQVDYEFPDDFKLPE